MNYFLIVSKFLIDFLHILIAVWKHIQIDITDWIGMIILEKRERERETMRWLLADGS